MIFLYDPHFLVPLKRPVLIGVLYKNVECRIKSALVFFVCKENYQTNVFCGLGQQEELMK